MNEMQETPWYMANDAVRRAERLSVGGTYRMALQELARDGVTILRGVVSAELCQAVIHDYESWATQQMDYVRQNLDESGREKRLVNFHVESANCLGLILGSGVLDLLDQFFRSEAGIYTSLTFKFGTQQPVHKDTPHFATWPKGRFAGVWFALEDVAPDSGPVFYYRGGHMLRLDESVYLTAAEERHPSAAQAKVLATALDLFNGEVINSAPSHGAYFVPHMSRGDAIIWHPELPHGGLPAADPHHTRWSTVFHCAPVDTQVHQHESFFLNARSRVPPPPRYGFTEHRNRKVALAGGIAYM